jgi:hypothetical protein
MTSNPTTTNTQILSAKERFLKQYQTYDFIFQIDGKSLEDQKTIWTNPQLKHTVKRVTVLVEVLSGSY